MRGHVSSSYVLAAEKHRKEKTTPFGVNLMRSQVLYKAAQVLAAWYAVHIAPGNKSY